MRNWPDTVISQYANSPSIQSILESINTWIDPAADFDKFYRLIWDLSTAEGYGLDVWGRIVGVNRVVSLANVPKTFGFLDSVKDYSPFNDEPFFSGSAATTNYALSDASFRSLIFIKAASNISNSSVQSLNSLISQLFTGRGRVYVKDYGGMAMAYNFEFYLRSSELAILQQSGVLPRPTGVRLYIVANPIGSTFGFREMGEGIVPFGQGAFFSAVPAVLIGATETEEAITIGRQFITINGDPIMSGPVGG